MATGDHLRHHRWSGGTIYGSRTWSGGTIHSNIICHRWSGGTHFGGTICGMTEPHLNLKSPVSRVAPVTINAIIDVMEALIHRDAKSSSLLACYNY